MNLYNGEIIKDLFMKYQLDFTDINLDSLNNILINISEISNNGFIKRDKINLAYSNNVLSEVYKRILTVVDPSNNSVPQNDWHLHAIRGILERDFVSYEFSRVDFSILDDTPNDTLSFIEWLYDYMKNHKAANHDFYTKYMRDVCDEDSLRYYYLQESTIDAATDDFLALLQVGVRGKPKMAIAKNYWDEMGCGIDTDVHATIFSDVGSQFSDPISSMNYNDILVESLICGNLQNMLCLDRKYFYAGVGYFAAVEYLSPIRFRDVLKAWKRSGYSQEAIKYYSVHCDIDVVHTEEWKKDVLFPLIEKHDGAKREIFLGISMRLNTSIEYLDALSKKMIKQ